MKKIMALVCALGLAGGASAQVKTAKDFDVPMKNSMLQSGSEIGFNLKSQVKNAKSAGDTIYGQPVYQQGDVYVSFSWVGGVEADQLANQAAVFLTMGTGWLNYYMGSGEIGYHFDLSSSGWYQMVNDVNLTGGYITAALVDIARLPSTKLDPKDSMPVYFKIYNNPFVAEQDVFTSINEYGPQGETETVHYPVDPDKHFAKSEVIKVDLKPYGQGGSDFPGYARYGAKFERYDQPAGDHLCISVVLPSDNFETDTLWNATLFTLQDASGTPYLSDAPLPMYVVIDFDKQQMWSNRQTGERLDERPEDGQGSFLPAGTPQTNKRYAVVPWSSWWFKNGQLDGETAFGIVVVSEADIESANPMDKYVEVSPIPAIDNVTIKSADRISRVDIFSLNGGRVMSQECNGNQVSVSVASLQSGMYIAKVVTDGGTATKKIVVR